MDTILMRDRLEKAVLQAMDQTAIEMQWGHDDCGLWCASIINSVLGYDPCQHLRGKYSDRDSCYQIVEDVGAELERIAKDHSWREISPDEAEPGDIGLTFLRKLLFAIVICRSSGWFVGRNEHGWTAIGSKHIQKAFSVI